MIASAAFDRFIEMKNEVRGVFQDDLAAKLGLENGTIRFQFGHDLGAIFRPENADKNVGGLEIGRDIDVIDRDQGGVEIDFAGNDLAQYCVSTAR